VLQGQIASQRIATNSFPREPQARLQIREIAPAPEIDALRARQRAVEDLQADATSLSI